MGEIGEVVEVGDFPTVKMDSTIRKVSKSMLRKIETEHVCKDRIINIVGASGSGKTTIAKELEKKGFNIIQSYSTRKPRYEGEWGHTFLDVDDGWYRENVENSFVGMSKLNNSFEVVQYIDIDDMIAYFNDYDKDEHYFATYDQYQGKGTSIYIVDSDGAEQVKRNVSDAEVVTILLNTDREQDA